VKRASLTLALGLLLAAGLALWLWARATTTTNAPAASTPEPSASVESDATAAVKRPTSMDAALATQRSSAGSTYGTSANSGPASDACILGWVWRGLEKGRVALPEVPLKLWRVPSDGRFPEQAEPLASGTTGTLGSCSFRGLATGAYFVAAQRKGGPLHVARVVVEEPGAWISVEFLLGTGSLHGVAYGLDGAPVAGLGLELVSTAHRSETHWSDESGHYSFEDLPEGHHALHALRKVGAPSSWQEESYRVHLAEGESRTLDVGSPELPLHWRGRLTVATGEPILPNAVVRFDVTDAIERFDATDAIELPPETRETHENPPREEHKWEPGVLKSRACVRVGVDGQGRFEAALIPDHWTAKVELDPVTQRTKDLGDSLLEHVDLVRDLVCPGVRLRGRVLGQAGLLASKALRVIATPTSNPIDNLCSAAVDAQGAFVLDGVGPDSDWRIDLDPLPKGFGCKPVRLHFEQEDRLRSVELALKRE